MLLVAGLLGMACRAGFTMGAAPSFAVVVHRSNPTANLRLGELRAIFVGGTRQWQHGPRVVVVERNPQSEVFDFLLQNVLSMSAVEYKRWLANIEFSGQAPLTVKVLNSDPAACKFVLNVPGAIALVETDSLHSAECGNVQVLHIEGKLPGEQGYRLR